MKILDMCCWWKMFWRDKENPLATFIDIRNINEVLCDWRQLSINPDIVMDFKELNFKDNTFDLVVFDPPHLKKIWEKSRMLKKYWILNKDTRPEDLKKWFIEWLRVLKDTWTLIFKRSEKDIKVQEIIRLFWKQPLLGNRTSKNTIWIVFNKN